jgi:hypothetical protein
VTKIINPVAWFVRERAAPSVFRGSPHMNQVDGVLIGAAGAERVLLLTCRSGGFHFNKIFRETKSGLAILFCEAILAM